VRARAPAVILAGMGHHAEGLLADPPDELRAFIRDGRITAIPASHARRRLLLDQVAQAFSPGRHYSEAAVDEALRTIFDDHCALRRYLVDEAFMSRTASGIYWRAGGTVS
jgi:hypothetical protein